MQNVVFAILGANQTVAQAKFLAQFPGPRFAGYK